MPPKKKAARKAAKRAPKKEKSFEQSIFSSNRRSRMIVSLATIADFSADLLSNRIDEIVHAPVKGALVMGSDRGHR